MALTTTRFAQFAEDFPQIAAWMEASPTFDFAQSLRRYAMQHGTLTPGQFAAANKCLARRADTAKREAEAPEASLPAMEEAFRRASDNGLKRPGMNIGLFRFTLARDTSRNPGAIYAKHKGTGTYPDDGSVYLGKFHQGRFVASRDCSAEQVEELMLIAKDPVAAAIKHGRLTGDCAICSRRLSDPMSVERGIGPICYSKFFG